MADAPTIIQGVSAAAQAAQAGGEIYRATRDAQQGPVDVSLPEPEAPARVPGPEPDRTNFSDNRPMQLEGAPNFLQLGSGLSPQQQRSRIATMGVAGEDARFRDDAARDYYRNLSLYTLTDPSGNVASGARVLPIERQYLKQVYGQEPRTDSIESYLSALLRG